MKVDDGLALVLGDPVVAWDEGVVLVDLPVALPPLVELAASDTDPVNEAVAGELGGLGPAVDEIYDGVSGVVGSPSAG